MHYEKMSVWVGGCLLMTLALLVCTLSGCTALHFGKTCLVKEGQPMADIVIADKPPRTVKLAAEELQAYVEKISGAKLAITNAPGQSVPAHIYVGRSAYTDKLNITDEGLKYGAFRMVSDSNCLVLLGHDTDYSLPKYAPSSAGDIPRAIKDWDARTGEHWGWPFPDGRIFRQYNGKVGVSYYDERGSLNAVYEFLRGQGVRWYMPGELGEIVPAKKTIELAPMDKTVRPDFGFRNVGDYSPTFDYGARDDILYKLRLGFDPTMGIPGPHGLANVAGRPEVRKAHPEFYANHTSPAPDKYDYANCLSSPELFAETLKYARSMFEIYPDMQYISLWPMDGFYSGNMCRCDLCKGKDTPKRGGKGELSDYVWEFVERVAQELYKTHPDKKVICGAYGAYTLPPEKIAKFSPNVMVEIVDTRSLFANPEVHDKAMELRKGWLEKVVPGNMYTYNYYLYSPSRLPVYFPHAVAEDLRSLKGLSQGEYIELSQQPYGARGMDAPGFNHLNVYVTSQYYWDADQDIEALLNEYYEKFYGPAAKEMKAFIEYSEANWPRMDKEVATITRALELLAVARQAAGDTVYGKRVELLAGYCQASLTQLRDRLAKSRETGLPKSRAARELSMANFKLDGKLDDKTWEGVEAYGLSELETGAAPDMRTSFQVGWGNESFYFGIRCEERDTKHLAITAAKSGDTNLFAGDFVELLIETQSHSYYRIAIDPAGNVVNTDRKNGTDSQWASGAEVATFVGDGFWSVEVHLPVAGDQQETLDPHNGISGRKPSPMYPWSINVCRQRVRPLETQRSAFSPTGKTDFEDVMKFGELHVR